MVVPKRATLNYWTDSDLQNGKTIGEADAPVMWCCSNEPVTKFQTNGAKIGYQERSKSRTMRFTNVETLL